jgi:eukaryotic-like serine/threonine-protein kinase
VDWARAETGEDVDPATLQGLRKVERIADFHRSVQRDGAEAGPALPGRPRRWGDLIVLQAIGAGARGEVWRAWDSTLQRQVALKFLQSTDATDSGRADLLNEARSLARVRHGSVVTVHGIAEHDGRAGMWMECLEGITLAGEIERIGRLPVRQVVHIALQLCSALDALQSAGIVHRDIKPSNVILEANDRVVLTDFGLGWRATLEDLRGPRPSGTPMFMAPEILAGRAATPLSDIYALGVTLWWALAGEGPYQAKTLEELRTEIEKGPARSLEALRPDAPRPLIKTIQAAMAVAPEDRPRGAADFASRIREKFVAIAVLPFANPGRDPEEEYFTEGLTDELMQVLGKVRGIRVAARFSTFKFKGREATVAEIGSALNVTALLEGSVRRQGDRVRISVQLVQVSDGYHLWAGRYDRALGDIFAVQDDIARAVVKELRATLLGEEPDPDASRQVSAEIAQAARGRATDPEAHRLYLLGRHFVRRLSPEDIGKGIEYLKQAIALHPEFALAWAELSGGLSRGAGRGLLPHAEGYARAREAVQRALALEPNLGEAHTRLAAIQMFYDWSWDEARASYARALAQSPGDVVALGGAGVLAMGRGDTPEAIALHRRAVEQDPLNSGTYSNLGLTLVRANQPAEAEEVLRRGIELDPRRMLLRWFLAVALVDQGRGDEALAVAEQEPDAGSRLFALGIVHTRMGHRAESDALLRELIEFHGAGYAYQIAELSAIRDDVDQAFAWLERAYEQRDSGLSDLPCSTGFLHLRDDPRWLPLLRKMGFVRA